MAWPSVHSTLHSIIEAIPTLGGETYIGIAGTNKFLSHQDDQNPNCPSCHTCLETCTHIVKCRGPGRTKAFTQSVSSLAKWLAENDTDPDVPNLLLQFIRSRGDVTCLECATNLPPRYQLFAKSQDVIDWGCLMEGMVSKQLVELQKCHLACCNSCRSIEKWMTGLVSSSSKLHTRSGSIATLLQQNHWLSSHCAQGGAPQRD